MASQKDPAKSFEHVAIFPPATHQACKLETWSNTPIKTVTASGIVETHVYLPIAIEDVEAERWVGMS